MDDRTHTLMQLDQLESLLEVHLATPPDQRNIGELLANVTGPGREAMIEELISIDIEMREQEGESPVVSDYLCFDDSENQMVRRLFSDLSSGKSSQIDDVLRSNRPKLPTRYEQLEQIGQGGVGEVWKVMDQKVQRPLALKVLRDKYRSSRQANMRMQREAMLTGLLQHPGIPPMHDSGTLSDGSHFFSMKLVQGRTLHDICAADADSNDSLANRLNIFAAVTQAMAFAHSQHIIHRDLKPQNVMVGQFGEVHVMDWGMARRLKPDSANEEPTTNDVSVRTTSRSETISRANDSSIDAQPCQTMMGDVIGTPRYMAPEQARGELHRLDARSDVYSLGAILFELLTSKRFHAEESSASILKKAATGTLANALQPLESCDADPSLIKLCRSCLSGDMNDRPADAGEIANAISEYMISAQQRARNAEIELRETEVRALEQSKRRRTFNRMLTAVGMAVVLGVAGILWQWNNAKTASNRTAGVLDVVTKSFRSIMPTSGGTSEMTAKEVLVNARKKLGESDLDEEGELVLLQNLTSCFIDLGEYNDAISTAEEALEICESLYGIDSLEHMKLTHFHAQSQMRLGQTVEAKETLDDLSRKYVALFGENHEDTLSAQMTLAGCYFRNGEREEAETRYEKLRGQMETKFGTDSRHHLTVVTNLIGIFHSLNRYDDALALGTEYLPKMQTVLGEDHPESLMMVNNLAAIYFGKKDYPKAVEMFAMAKEMMESRVGESHPYRLGVISNLAMATTEMGNQEEAISLLQPTIPLMDEKLGVSHPSTLRTRIVMAAALADLERYDESIELYEETIKTMEDSLGKDHQLTELARVRYGNVLLRTDDARGSIAKFQKIFEDKKARLGAEHPMTIAELNMLVWTIAISDVNEGRVDEKLLEEFRRGCEITKDPNHLNSLATAQYRDGQFELAIENVEKTIALEMKKNSGLAGLALNMLGGQTKSEPHASNYALLAMCHFKLGNVEKSKEYSAKYESLLDAADDDMKHECEFFTKQLEELTVNP